MTQFRSSYIQGFHDEIAHSLDIEEHSELLATFENQVSLGTSNINRINIPVIFVICGDGAEGDASALDINTFSGGSNDPNTLALELLDIFNTCLEDLTLNIRLHLSIRGREDGDLLPYSGIVFSDLSQVSQIKSAYNTETLQVEQIEDFYKDKGVSIHNIHINGGAMEGITKSIVLSSPIASEYTPEGTSNLDSSIQDVIDFNKVLTIVLVNKLNIQNYKVPSSLNQIDLGAYFTGVHPALADVKNYVSFLPFSSLNTDLTDAYLPELYQDRGFNLSQSKRVLVTMLGSMFGLLNPGTPDKEGLQSINPIAGCIASDGCILTGSNGDCISDVPIVGVNLYYIEPLDTKALSSCTIDSEEYNFMNFSYDFSNQTSEVFSISEQQISKVRSAFNLTDCVLRDMTINFPNFISEQDYLDIYCETNSPRVYKQTPFVLNALNNSIKSVRSDMSDQALIFNKLKDKINFLCNSIIYR